jgi:hypothetical protein
MEPRKGQCAKADAVEKVEGNIATPRLALWRDFAGVVERGMYARVSKEPGRSHGLQPEW